MVVDVVIMATLGVCVSGVAAGDAGGGAF